MDRLGWKVEITPQRNWNIVDGILEKKNSDVSWYMPYEVIELFFAAKRNYCEECEFRSEDECNDCEYIVWYKAVTIEINMILEQEKSEYRLLRDILITKN